MSRIGVKSRLTSSQNAQRKAPSKLSSKMARPSFTALADFLRSSPSAMGSARTILDSNPSNSLMMGQTE